MLKKSLSHNLFIGLVFVCLMASAAFAQTTAFTYQGKLSNGGTPASGTYEMQFKLFDALTDGTQVGATITNTSVAVAAGIFTVELDFAAGAFDGTARYLEICVRPAGDPNPYTVLAPRQSINSTPYAVRSANATVADALSPAFVGCVGDTHIETVDGAKITGEIPTASVPTGSDNYIQNSEAALKAGKNSLQLAANFNINGNGTAAGTLSGNRISAQTSYDLGGSPILSNSGNNNLFAGVLAGLQNTDNTGSDNALVGAAAGLSNSTANQNSFFGSSAGMGNTSGSDNSYFGAYAGQASSTGSANSFFGVVAGYNNLGNDNSFFGRSAGFTNTTGTSNSYFGVQAGRDNSTSSANSFFGRAAGIANSTGSENSFFGFNAGFNTTTGSANTFIGYRAGIANITGGSNVYIGNSTYGVGDNGLNVFVGNNIIVGGNENTYVGFQAGHTGIGNVAVGNLSGSTGGSSGPFNYTVSLGYFSETGANESIAIGHEATILVGDNSIAIGPFSKVIEDNSIAIGYNAQASFNALNSVAIGANAFVNTPNTVVLGTASETVRIPGSLIVTGTVSKGGGSFKIDHPLDPENKTLSHSFVESPDMMNIYNGVVTLSRRGEAVITLPNYFEALNRDFRYQLTCIGGFAPVFIAQEIKHNRFKIAGGKSNMKISWQITGIRHDAYAEVHRIPVEEAKPASERGTYLHPEAFKQSSKNANGVLIKGKARQRYGKARR